MAEIDGSRISSVLAADSKMNVRANLRPLLYRNLNQLTYAVLVQMCEGILLVNLGLIVILQEFACVIAGEAEGHLRQVIGSEAEELCLLCDLICHKGCTRNLDHGSDVVPDIGILLRLHLLSGIYDLLLDKGKLLHIADKRNHDFRNDIVAVLFLHFDGSLDDGSGLHSGDKLQQDGIHDDPSSG